MKRNANHNIGMIVAAIMVVYCFLVNYYAINLPKYDDYRNILAFLNDYGEVEGFSKISTLLKPSEEHRNMTVRLITLGLYSVFDEINFIHLVRAGQLFLWIWLGVMFKSLFDRWNRWLLIPFLFIILQFSSFDTILWGLVSIQHVGVICFATGSLYALSRKGHCAFILSILLATLATFTFGNGFITFVAGVFLLYQQGRKKEMMIWSSVAILVIMLYFVGHNTPRAQYAVHYNPLDLVLYFFSLIGNMVGWSYRVIAILIGLICTGLMGMSIVKKHYRDYPLHFSYVLFLFLTLIAVSLNRFFVSPHHAFANHYKFYPVVYITLLLLLWLRYIPLNRTKLIALGAFSVVFNLVTNAVYIPKAKQERDLVNENMMHWVSDQGELLDNAPRQAEETLNKALEKGYYKIPEKYLKK